MHDRDVVDKQGFTLIDAGNDLSLETEPRDSARERLESESSCGALNRFRFALKT
jgi:hypothetical protein